MDDLALDATSSYFNGGRPYEEVAWTVSAISSKTNNLVDTSNVEDYLNSYSAVYQVTRPMIISSQNLTAASYTITLSLTNFLGVSASTSIYVAVSTSTYIPNLSIIGPVYRTTVAASPLTILSIVTLPSCAFNSTKVSFVWTVTQGAQAVTTAITSASSDPARFSLTAYKLTVDTLYTITVTATAGDTSVSASTTVYVAHGAVTAAIVGGNVRSVPVDKVLVLDGSISSDSDKAPSDGSIMTYKVILNQ